MKYPIRLLVLERLKKLLEGVTEIRDDAPAYDLTGSVYLGRSLVGTEMQRPAIAMVEAPRPDFALFAGEEWVMRKDRLTLLIEGYADNDVLNPGTEAYWLVAAVEARLSMVLAVNPNSGSPKYPEHYLLGETITGLEIAPPVVRPPDDNVSKTAYFFLPIRVGLAVDLKDPYVEVQV